MGGRGGGGELPLFMDLFELKYQADLGVPYPPLRNKSAKQFLKKHPKELVRMGQKGCNLIGQTVTTTRAVLINIHNIMSKKLRN